ncbi:hypothetical protein MRN42_17690 [bacterium 19NY04SH03]|uniref:Uncharacterized protein n=1 Tax=bacterium 19NY04SH03 TaxID=2920647 RepID=A0AAU6UN69_UNCXX
MELSCQCVVS